MKSQYRWHKTRSDVMDGTSANAAINAEVRDILKKKRFSDVDTVEAQEYLCDLYPAERIKLLVNFTLGRLVGEEGVTIRGKEFKADFLSTFEGQEEFFEEFAKLYGQEEIEKMKGSSLRQGNQAALICGAYNLGQERYRADAQAKGEMIYAPVLSSNGAFEVLLKHLPELGKLDGQEQGEIFKLIAHQCGEMSRYAADMLQDYHISNFQYQAEEAGIPKMNFIKMYAGAYLKDVKGPIQNLRKEGYEAVSYHYVFSTPENMDKKAEENKPSSIERYVQRTAAFLSAQAFLTCVQMPEVSDGKVAYLDPVSNEHRVVAEKVRGQEELVVHDRELFQVLEMIADSDASKNPCHPLNNLSYRNPDNKFTEFLEEECVKRGFLAQDWKEGVGQTQIRLPQGVSTGVTFTGEKGPNRR